MRHVRRDVARVVGELGDERARAGRHDPLCREGVRHGIRRDQHAVEVKVARQYTLRVHSELDAKRGADDVVEIHEKFLIRIRRAEVRAIHPLDADGRCAVGDHVELRYLSRARVAAGLQAEVRPIRLIER